jgi:hypothetical protein
MDTYRAAPQGSDIDTMLHFNFGANPMTLYGLNQNDFSLDGKLHPNSNIKVSMDIEFKHTARGKPAWHVSRKRLEFLARRGEVLVLVENGIYYVFNAIKLVEFWRAFEDFACISIDHLPDFGNRNPAETNF